jgi:uncharacterized protein with HEPN domain
VRDPLERIQDMLESVQRIEKYASQGRRAFDSDELIQGTRHILVHDYFQVDLEVVWRVVEKDLPDLKRKLRDINSPGAREPKEFYKAHGLKLKRGKKK